MANINDPVDKDEIPDHKLCGFLCAVLLIPPSHSSQTIAPGTRCCILSEGHDVGFATEDGVVLLPVDSDRDVDRPGSMVRSDGSFREGNVAGTEREDGVGGGIRVDLGFCSGQLGSCEDSMANSLIGVGNPRCNGLEREGLGYSEGKFGSCEDSMLDLSSDFGNSQCNGLEREGLGFSEGQYGSCEDSMPNSLMDVENSNCNGLEREGLAFSEGHYGSCEDSMLNSLMDVENSNCNGLKRGDLGILDEKLGSCEGLMPKALMDVENSKRNGSKRRDSGVSKEKLNSCEDSIPNLSVDAENFKFNGLEGRLGGSVVECRTSSSARSKVSSRKKTRGIGFVHGSMSVVHQIHALVADKCFKIAARVVGVRMNHHGERRVVVLVDVYLPLAVWLGWQFPRSKSVAGALFGHLSCDWGKRAALFAGGEHHESANWYDKSLWELSNCHVLECKLHPVISYYSKKRLFDLHEIFKSSPSVGKRWSPDFSRVKPASKSCGSGMWELSDDVIVNILSLLRPLDLVRVASTCHHLRSLAVSIMPCMKLKLFPHQQAAVEWMIQRERNAEVLQHPLFREFSTEDGFVFSVNSVSGELISGVAPVIKDFRGGMFCDEPGLGKTITALSLILKTQGTLADPPEWEQVIWCTHKGEKRCGYYEIGGNCSAVGNVSLGKNFVVQTPPKAQLSRSSISPTYVSEHHSAKRARLDDSQIDKPHDGYLVKEPKSAAILQYEPAKSVIRCTRSLNRIKKNLFYSCEDEVYSSKEKGRGRKSRLYTPKKKLKGGCVSQWSCKRASRAIGGSSEVNETWVQCDACHKWRKLQEMNAPDTTAAWFCSMNADPMYQNCSIPEEHWDNRQPITFLQGFCAEGSPGGEEQNIAFFITVLKDHYALIDSHTTKALSWLAELSPDKLSQMETTGLKSPCVVSVEDSYGFHKIFQAFGLLRRVEKGINRWHYPKNIKNLTFDVAALQIALREPLNSVRLYMSRATLVVVPANLVDHWKTQIERHVRPGQLRVYILTDGRKICPHNLAWDYDVVITTFSRLSAEWAPRKRSVLKQVHWLRIMLDEGHTLGSSLNLTNKLQMAISLVASNRWILTGTPTPNTPNSQLPQLQTMFKFLHQEVYGQSHKLWEAGVQRPFEAYLEEGRSRLVDLLQKCMISARKTDLRAIPPCIKKVTFLNFTKEHAISYNELVATVRRNILMADWNDPSHVESLLNPKQWKFRGTTIRNVRLSCCVAGHIKVTDVGEDIQETMDILSQSGLDPSSEEYALIKYSLMHGGHCLRCKEWCRLPVITPCQHLLCLDCVALNRERCTSPGCGYSYEMQTPETRPDNPNPKWPVPKDLIELQPSYKQDDWDPDWQSTSSSKVAYLVERLKDLRDSKTQVRLCSSEENGFICYKKQPSVFEMNCLVSSFKPNYQSSSEKDFVAEKVIIFSQFLEHIHVIEQQLMLAGIGYAGMYSPMHSSNKMKSLANFQYDDDCMALLMDGSAALGLDLSFVTHVFLMEPIWDKSMEEQVISRAHRMGATRPIYVETLAMCGTIEQQMVEFLQDADSCRRFLKEEFGKLEDEGARGRRSLHDFAGSNYLSQLKCIHTNSSM